MMVEVVLRCALFLAHFDGVRHLSESDDCIIGRALFPGSAVDEQLLLIFHVLGTPSPQLHPSICNSPAFKNYKFPHYYPAHLPNICPRIDQTSLDLLLRLLQVSLLDNRHFAGRTQRVIVEVHFSYSHTLLVVSFYWGFLSWLQLVSIACLAVSLATTFLRAIPISLRHSICFQFSEVLPPEGFHLSTA